MPIMLGAVVACAGATFAVQSLLDNVHAVVPGVVYRSAQLSSSSTSSRSSSFAVMVPITSRGSAGCAL
jgi:hypothetical protein